MQNVWMTGQRRRTEWLGGERVIRLVEHDKRSGLRASAHDLPSDGSASRTGRGRDEGELRLMPSNSGEHVIVLGPMYPRASQQRRTPIFAECRTRYEHAIARPNQRGHERMYQFRRAGATGDL